MQEDIIFIPDLCTFSGERKKNVNDSYSEKTIA